jgi:hypothetical protein
MRQPGTVVVSKRRQENLSFVLQPAKGFGMDDAVAVALESRADGMRLLRSLPAPGVYAKTGPGRKNFPFCLLNLFPYVQHGLFSHLNSSSFFYFMSYLSLCLSQLYQAVYDPVNAKATVNPR